MPSIDVILQETFGLESFRAHQRTVIEDVMAQRDVLCVMPTGAGKSLLLGALGLAITYGVMGIINMAHGELLMIGAYSGYAMQSLFRAYWPEAIDWYLPAAIPLAFFAAAAVGVVMERTVIRWLYGRPLETLLARYEEGARLVKVCQDKLAEAELKIQQLEKSAAGDLKLKPVALSEE